MLDDRPFAEIDEIAASAAPLPDRAQAVVATLSRCLPSDGAWLALSAPKSTVYTTVGGAGLDPSVVSYLDRPSVAQEIELTGYNRNRPPVSVGELAVAAEELPTWAECLIPAGFQDAWGVALFEPGGPLMGVLSLLFSSREPLPVAARERLAQLSPLIARAVSPTRTLLATARLVRGARAGAVLLQDGSTHPLAGLEDHAALGKGSPIIDLARSMLLDGQVYRSFLWPAREPRSADGHIRITVLAATELPGSVLGMLLVTPDVDCRGLTPRELEVLGLLMDGRSNQQIARTLAVAPRTVAAHIEHVLHKMKVPSRTAAAVRAEREGCYVPATARVPVGLQP